MGDILLHQPGESRLADGDRHLEESRERERILVEDGWAFAGNITPDWIGGPYAQQRERIEVGFPGSQFERLVDVMSAYDDSPEDRELILMPDYSVLYASPTE